MNRPRASRALARAAVAALVVLSTVAVPAAGAGAAPATISGVEPVSYTEGGPPVAVAPGIEISGGGTFADGYIEFDVTGAGPEDRLFLPEGSSPDSTAGTITVIGVQVYLGLGDGEHKQIGTVHPIHDGQQGRPLRIDFSAALPNASFSEGVDANGHPVGWTINERHITMPTQHVAKTQGRAMGAATGSGPTYTIHGPGYSFVSDNAYGSGATAAGWRYEGAQRALAANEGARLFDSSVVNGELRLFSQDSWCESTSANSYCSVFGPDAWSSSFVAKAGDDLAFDWTAANGNDDYEVYGYLVDVDTFAHTELMYGRGRHQPWRTSVGKIPADGTYRFRFLSGTYDATGGRQVGASLYIDDVRVLSSDANAAVAQAVARLVHYEHTGQNPPAEITIGLTTSSSDGPTNETIAAEVELVDDAPTIDAVSDAVFTNTMGVTTFSSVTGRLHATDPEGDPIRYSIDGATPAPETVDGVTYTHRFVGTYATIHLDESTGAYAVVPRSDVLDAQLRAADEDVTVRATANGLSAATTLRVRVEIEASAPGAPIGLTATAGDELAELSWTAPQWTGGSDVTGYRIEQSLDGGTTWSTVVADTGSPDTTATIPGLTNGDTVSFRVAAINLHGTGAPTDTASATPLGLPDAPTAVAALPADGAALLSWTAPVDDGGTAITGYRIETSTDEGLTWSPAIEDTGSTSTTATVTGLSNGTSTWFRVASSNGVGTGDASAPTSTIPRTVPGAPIDLTVTPGDGTAALAWSPPLHDGGAAVTGYLIEQSRDGGTTWSTVVADTGSTDTTADVTGLTNGTPTTFRVTAINVAGPGTPATPVTSTARTVPDAPTITSIKAGNRTLTVSFAAPADGGAPIEAYEYSVDGGLTWQRHRGGVDSTLVIGPLDNRTAYPVRIRAINAAGAGASSNEVSGSPLAAPVRLPGTTPGRPSNGAPQLVDGAPRPIVVTTPSPLTGDFSAPRGTLRLTDGSFRIDIRGIDRDRSVSELDARGRLVLTPQGAVAVSGHGFRPGSTVDVWLMHEPPILLGEVTVGPDGAFATSLPVPEGIRIGDTTIQLNGVAADSTLRTVTLDATVLGLSEERRITEPAQGVAASAGGPTATPAARPASLAFTGAHAAMLSVLGALALLLGATLLAGARRGRASTSRG